MKENALVDKSFNFSIRIVKTYEFLTETAKKKNYVLAKQLLRAGTSIGANISEANGAISNADFSNKMSIAYKECLETKYWLSLLKHTGYIDDITFNSVNNDAEEISKLLFASVKTSKLNYNKGVKRKKAV